MLFFVTLLLFYKSIVAQQFMVSKTFCLTNSTQGLSINNNIEDSPFHYDRHFYPKSETIIEKNYVNFLENTTKFDEYVTDLRWENLPEMYTSYNQKYIKVLDVNTLNFSMVFSMRIKDQGHILLCDDDSSPFYSNCYWIRIGTQENTVAKCLKGMIADNYDLSKEEPCINSIEYDNEHSFHYNIDNSTWNHFRLNIYNKTQLQLYQNKNLLFNHEDKHRTFNIKHVFFHSNQNTGLWKIHELNFTEGAFGKFLKVLTYKVNPNQKGCISMMIRMCRTCSIQVLYMKANTNKLHEMKYIKTEEWKEIKFSYQQNFSLDLYFHFEHEYPLKGVTPFWHFSDARACSQYESRVLSILPHKIQTCQLLGVSSLDLTLFHGVFRANHKNCPEKSFGDTNCLTCQDIFSTKNCPDFTFCSADVHGGTCFCYTRNIFLPTECDTEPEPIGNLNCSCIPSCQCTWKEPLVKLGNVSYFYELKFRDKNFCSNNPYFNDNIERNTTQFTSLTMKSLRLDSLYKLTVFVKSNGLYSQGVSTEFTTKSSNKVQNFELPAMEFFKTDNSLSLSWNWEKITDQFEVFLSQKCLTSWCENYNETKTRIVVNCSDVVTTLELHSFVNYSLTVHICRQENCLSSSLKVQTNPSVPHNVRELSVESYLNNTVVVRWLPPFPPTGVLDQYFVQSNGNPVTEVIITPCKLWTEFICAKFQIFYLFSNLYSFMVQAANVTPKIKNNGSYCLYLRFDSYDISEAPFGYELVPETSYFNLKWYHPNYTSDLKEFYVYMNDELAFTYNAKKLGFQKIYSKQLNSSNLSCSRQTITMNSDVWRNRTETVDVPPLKPKHHIKVESSTKTITLKLQVEYQNDAFCTILVGFTNNDNFEPICKPIVDQRKFELTLGSNKNECSETFNSSFLNEELKPETSYNVTIQLQCSCLESNGTAQFSIYLPVKTQGIPNMSYLLVLFFIPILLIITMGLLIYRKKTIRRKQEYEFKEIITRANLLPTKRRGKKGYVIPDKILDIEQFIRESLINHEVEKQHEMILKGEAKPRTFNSSPVDNEDNNYVDLNIC